MHLINGKLAGKAIPDRLPESLIPPSLRQSQTAARPGPFQAPVSQIQRDLFELDNSPPTSPTAPESVFGMSSQSGILQPQSTGMSASTGSVFTTPKASQSSFPPISTPA